MLSILGTDERGLGKLRLGKQWFPGLKLVLRWNLVLFCEAGAPRGVRFRDRDEADFVRVLQCVQAIRICAALACPDEDGMDRGGDGQSIFLRHSHFCLRQFIP